MRIIGPFVAIVVLTTAGAGGQAGAVPDRPSGRAHAAAPLRSYLVLLEDRPTAGRATIAAARPLGVQADHVYRYALRGYSARMTAAQARSVARRPEVRAVQPDHTVRTLVQTTPTGVNRVNADASPTAGIDGVDRRVNADVAVIDTGVDLDHPDLNVFREGGVNCSGSGVGANDQNGHGTHVAGTIGALDNRRGVVGVAPGARIWPVRVLGANGSGTLGDVICGIDFVTANADRIEVANMSLGTGARGVDNRCGTTTSDLLHRAVCASVAAGVTYSVAAGNSGQDAAWTIPAAYPEVITVSAIADFDGRPGGRRAATCRPDVDDTFADFSNFGAAIDIAAPGVCIRSTWRNGGFATISGTSMASPHVAGAAALHLATHPNTAPTAVRAALLATGSRQWSSKDDPDGVKEPLLEVTGF